MEKDFNVVKSGYLVKLDTAMQRTWKRRFIVLTDTSILYFEDHQTYPVVDQVMNPMRGCLSASGFVPACPKNPQSMPNSPNSGLPYLTIMPENRTPGGTPYTYISTDDKDNVCTSAPCSNYRITFSLEKQSGQLAPGMHVATKNGIE